MYSIKIGSWWGIPIVNINKVLSIKYARTCTTYALITNFLLDQGSLRMRRLGFFALIQIISIVINIHEDTNNGNSKTNFSGEAFLFL